MTQEINAEFVSKFTPYERTGSHLSEEVYLWVLSLDIGVAILFASLWEITAVCLAM